MQLPAPSISVMRACQGQRPERKTDRRWGVLKNGRSHASKGIGRGQGVKGPDGKFRSKDDTLESVRIPCTTKAINNPTMAAFFTSAPLENAIAKSAGELNS